MYDYKAKAIRVIDGDTAVLEIDFGMRIKHTSSFRLVGINTPELRGVDRLKGLEARDKLSELIMGSDNLIAHIHKHGKYRWLVELFVGDMCINDELVNLDLAKEVTY